jgi:integrase
MRGLRHTFGTRAAEAGVNPAITQQLMGHSSSQITLDYYTEAQTEAKLNALSMINGINASNISNE